MPILVFCRTPVPGRAKRRLIPVLGAEGAARLHARMALGMVQQAVKADLGPVQVWCTPTAEHGFFERLRRDYGIALFVQAGEDLGARMHNAFSQMLAQYDAAILVGSDCPTLNVRDFRSAARHLARGCRAVLTPTEDGGYALIGLTEPAPELFSGVAWGSAEVLGITRTRLAGLGLEWVELSVRRDIDRPEDLKTLDDSWLNG